MKMNGIELTPANIVSIDSTLSEGDYILYSPEIPKQPTLGDHIGKKFEKVSQRKPEAQEISDAIAQAVQDIKQYADNINPTIDAQLAAINPNLLDGRELDADRWSEAIETYLTNMMTRKGLLQDQLTSTLETYAESESILSTVAEVHGGQLIKKAHDSYMESGEELRSNFAESTQQLANDTNERTAKAKKLDELKEESRKIYAYYKELNEEITSIDAQNLEEILLAKHDTLLASLNEIHKINSSIQSEIDQLDIIIERSSLSTTNGMPNTYDMPNDIFVDDLHESVPPSTISIEDMYTIEEAQNRRSHLQSSLEINDQRFDHITAELNNIDNQLDDVQALRAKERDLYWHTLEDLAMPLLETTTPAILDDIDSYHQNPTEFVATRGIPEGIERIYKTEDWLNYTFGPKAMRQIERKYSAQADHLLEDDTKDEWKAARDDAANFLARVGVITLGRKHHIVDDNMLSSSEYAKNVVGAISSHAQETIENLAQATQAKAALDYASADSKEEMSQEKIDLTSQLSKAIHQINNHLDEIGSLLHQNSTCIDGLRDSLRAEYSLKQSIEDDVRDQADIQKAIERSKKAARKAQTKLTEIDDIDWTDIERRAGMSIEDESADQSNPSEEEIIKTVSQAESAIKISKLRASRNAERSRVLSEKIDANRAAKDNQEHATATYAQELIISRQQIADIVETNAELGQDLIDHVYSKLEDVQKTHEGISALILNAPTARDVSRGVITASGKSPIGREQLMIGPAEPQRIKFGQRIISAFVGAKNAWKQYSIEY